MFEDHTLWTEGPCYYVMADVYKRQGFNIQLDAVPLDGRITLRIATDKKD